MTKESYKNRIKTGGSLI